jgi:hypothetical protein
LIKQTLCNSFIAANEDIDSWKMSVKKNRNQSDYFFGDGDAPEEIDEAIKCDEEGLDVLR